MAAGFPSTGALSRHTLHSALHTLHSALGVVSLEMSALPRELTLVTLTSGETALPRVLGPVTGLTGQGRMVSDVAWCVSGGTL